VRDRLGGRGNVFSSFGATALLNPIRRHYQWNIAAPPERVWLALSDMGRLAEAVGLPEASYIQNRLSDGTLDIVGTGQGATFSPKLMRQWRDPPVEWIDSRWLHFRRIGNGGLLTHLDWTVAIDRNKQGCTVRHEVVFRPNGVLAAVFLSLFSRARFDRAMGEACRTVGQWAGGHLDYPFPKQRTLPRSTRDILSDGAMRADGSDYGQGQVSRLVQWISCARAHDIAPIRPAILAQMWNAPVDQVVEVLLAAGAAGIVTKQWRISCPRCGGGVSQHDRLNKTPVSVRCPRCAAQVERDFAKNVEIAFVLAPALKGFPTGRFAADGPSSHPGVLARVTVGARKRLVTKWQSPTGTVRVRVVDTGFETTAVTLDGDSPNLVISHGSISTDKGRQEGGTLEIVNQDDVQRIIDLSVLEVDASHYSARRALLLQAHRDIGGSELPHHSESFFMENVAVLATDLAGLAKKYRKSGSAQTFKEASELLGDTTDIVRGCGGSIPSRLGETIIAVFSEPGQALEAAQQLARHDQKSGRSAFRASIDLGDVQLTAHGERQVLRGPAVERSIRIMRALGPGELGLGEKTANTPGVIKFIQGYSLEPVAADIAAQKIRIGKTPPENDRDNGQSVSAA